MRKHLYFAIIACGIALTGLVSAEDNGNGRPHNFRKGLVGHYYRDARYWGGNWTATLPPKVDAKDWTFTRYAYTRIEPLVNHTYIKRGWFSVSWQGYVEVKGKTEANYIFSIWAQDGCRLIVNNKAVLDSWKHVSADAPESRRTGAIKLGPGKHKIRIEYFLGLNSGQDLKYPVKLFWKCLDHGISERVVPAQAFSHSVLDLPPQPGRKE